MSIYTTEDKKEIKRILISFKEKYKEVLRDEEDMEFLNDHIMYNELGEYVSDCFLNQIYEAAGLVKPSCSIYHQMTNIVGKYFDLKRDIVEVGSGIFPILGHSLSERQLKLGKGSVTVYDTKVWTEYPTKAKLVKNYFNQRVEVTPNSLLVGLFPCEATEMMIDRAKQEDLEFCIALCGCNHSSIRYLSTDEYHKMLIEQLRDDLSSSKTLKIEFFPSCCFGNECESLPILVVKNKPKVKPFTLPFKTR